MKIDISINGHLSNSEPYIEIDINDVLLYSGNIKEGTNTFTFDLDVLEQNILKIKHKNKSNNDTIVNAAGKIIADKAIELISISIENTPIEKTVLFNKKFFVEWPDNLKQDFINRGEEVPEFLTNSLYFGFNGTYQFDFAGDFLKQYFRQFWEDEDQAHRNQTKRISIDGQELEAFERFGKDTAIDESFNLTIHDLAKAIGTGEYIDNQTI